MSGWKVFAIILLIILIVENVFIAWGWYMIAQDERKTEECYYDVCAEYEEAYIVGNICYCYEYDVFDNYVVAKTQIIK